MAGGRYYSDATKAALFATSLKCYYPKCPVSVVKFFGEDPDVNVQIAHIKALNPGGPRYDRNFPEPDLNKFANLILLCKFHHDEVDKRSPEKYSVSVLQAWKRRAEKEARDNITGLDRLTEDKLRDLLREAAHSSKDAVLEALERFRGEHSESAALLRKLFDNIEQQYLNMDSIEMFTVAVQRLYSLEESFELLHDASHRLVSLDDDSSRLFDAASRLEELNISAQVNRLEEVSGNYADLVYRGAPDIPDIHAIAERAGDRLVEKIDRKVASIDLGGPPVLVNHEQRWKFALVGYALGVISVLAVVIILAANGAV